ncbi:class I SAM-dependent DNA methyltransferase [Parasphingorhabdus pacifica]
MDKDHAATFDLIGERYEKEFTERAQQYRAGEWVLERLPQGAAVLDLGCGTGVPTARQFADAGVDIVGVDESERMLDVARKHVPQARFVAGDMRNVDVVDGEFDAVVMFFALLMLSRAEIGEVLRAVRQRLRGPKLVSLSMVYGDFDSFPINFMGVSMEATAYPTDELLDVVREAGFRIESMWEADSGVERDRVEHHIFVCASVDEGAVDDASA